MTTENENNTQEASSVQRLVSMPIGCAKAIQHLGIISKVSWREWNETNKDGWTPIAALQTLDRIIAEAEAG